MKLFLILTETPGLLNLRVMKTIENKATSTKQVNEIERQILILGDPFKDVQKSNSLK